MTIIARAQNNQSPSEPLVEPMRINSRSGLQTTSAAAQDASQAHSLCLSDRAEGIPAK
jgi:hypothetical protein